MKTKSNNFKRLRFVLIAIVVLVGVVSIIGSGGGGGGGAGNLGCTLQEKLDIVYGIMSEIYLWADQVRDMYPYINWQTVTSPENLLSLITTVTLDPWSYLMTLEEYDDYYIQNKLIGLGFGLGLDDSDNIRIRYVYSNSPAGLAGLVRGDILLEVNGIAVDRNTNFGAVFGADEIGVIVDLRIQELGGGIRDVNLVKLEYVYDMIQFRDVINTGGRSIGYLVYQHFSADSIPALEIAAEEFNAAGITDLILDLRYNGGGLLSVTGHLGGMITGNDGTGIMSELLYNDMYSDYNHTVMMVDTPSAADLNLSRIVVITSVSTASASESLINGLEPYIDVVTVGSTTTGKPVGMNAFNICDEHILMAVTFETRNSLGQGEYYTGITPDCAADDNVTKAWGDETEDSLQEAIYYILNGQCSGQGVVRTVPEQRSRQIELTGFRKITGTF